MNKKKILFVSARYPYPPKEGHQLRTYGIIEQLCKNFDVHLLSILRPGEFIEESNLTKICKSVTGCPVSFGLKDNLVAGVKSLYKRLPLVVTRYVTTDLEILYKRILNDINPDIVHFDLLPLMGLAPITSIKTQIILNQHNVESELIKQKLNSASTFIDKVLYKREFKLLHKFENEACLRSDSTLACSDIDKNLLNGLGAKKVFTIPNGVNVGTFEPNYVEIDLNRLVFLGGMGWYPNKIGMQWFIDNVLPLIVKEKPDVIVDVIGNPEPRLNIPENLLENVIIHGFVDDFRPLVNQASIMIVPVTVGSGTRLKVVEGAAAGKCIVSTTKGSEGVKLSDGEEIFLADSPERFSSKIIELTSNIEVIKGVGTKARVVAEHIYDWDTIGKNLTEIYTSVATNG